MGYNELEIELRKTQAQIARWREMGYMPTIEQGIALGRLQKIYAGLLDLPCSEPEAQLEGVDAVGDATGTIETATDESVGSDREAVAKEIVPEMPLMADAGYDGVAPDDESFEPCCDPDVPAAATVPRTKAADDDNFADFSVGEGTRASDETHLKQEYGAHDLCPPPVEFPKGEDADSKETDVSADTSDTEKDESGEEDDRAGRSEEVHMMQEYGARDSSPSPEKFPEAEQNAVKVPEPPRIFGIEVSPYARHEIIDTLFHGNTELFEAETAKLDGMGSLEEALVYIGETYRWIPENAATIKFIDLLETRFEE